MSRGFTLVEVLVALAVVAFGMSAVLSAIGSAADNTIYLRDKMMAEWIALNRIAEQRLSTPKPAEGKTEGEVEFAGRRWRWEQEVQEIEIPGVFRIDVRVRPTDVAARNSGSWTTTVSGAMGDALVPPMIPPPPDRWEPRSRGANPGGRESNDDRADDGNEPPSGGNRLEPVRPPR